MSVLSVLVPLAVLGLLALFVVALLARRDALDLSPQTSFRTYLYLASFAGVVVAAFGFASLLQAGMAALFGNPFVYGGIPSDVRIQQTQQFEVRRAEDAVRGATFAVAGVGFWLVHWLARNRTGRGDQGALQRGYLLLGTAVFGVATVVLLPMGIDQALTIWFVPQPAQSFRGGVQDSLPGGIAALVIWLIYLRIVLWNLPRDGRRVEYTRNEPGPPREPTFSGARVSPGPSGRSAGAEAVPPREEH